MPRIYSQRRNDNSIVMIADSTSTEACRMEMARHANAWIRTKAGRTAKPMGNLELGLMFSDGKMAASIWVEMIPPPQGEAPFTPATGPVPGLGA